MLPTHFVVAFFVHKSKETGILVNYNMLNSLLYFSQAWHEFCKGDNGPSLLMNDIFYKNDWEKTHVPVESKWMKKWSKDEQGDSDMPVRFLPMHLFREFSRNYSEDNYTDFQKHLLNKVWSEYITLGYRNLPLYALESVEELPCGRISVEHMKKYCTQTVENAKKSTNSSGNGPPLSLLCNGTTRHYRSGI